MKGGLTDLLAALAGGLAVQLSGIMPSTLNNRAKLAERVFNQAHMVKHRRMRRGGVAGHDRLNHPGVLRMRAGDATFGAKLGPAKRRKPTAQPPREIGEHRVMRARIDVGMKRYVGDGVILMASDRGHLIMQALQAAAL